MPTSRDYAALSADSYNDRVADPNASYLINGVRYRVLATADNDRNGYQGTVYQRLDTREIIVAHRGTEPSNGVGEFWRDVVRTDGGMVVNASNNQAPDAIALTERALRIAREEGERSGRTPAVTTTGHSLGGTLAQIAAHRFGLHGETFNAYGAAGLNMGIPAGGNTMINHVRASDMVSAASPQFGQTRVYATPEDVSALQNAGYANNRSQRDIRNPLEVVWNRGLAAHDIGAFFRQEGGGPVLSPENERRAQQFDPMIDKFRGDVAAVRSGITSGSQGIRDGIDRLREGWRDLFSSNGTMTPANAPLLSDNPRLAEIYAASPQVASLDSRTVAQLAVEADRLQQVRSVAIGPNGVFALDGPGNNPATDKVAVSANAPQELAASSARSVAQETDRVAAVAPGTTREAEIDSRQTMRA